MQQITFAEVKQSFVDSLGDIVFGMEDGTVSIFGLVFGVAASATNSHTVLLAGATGAAAAAVSMMAGTYLDVETARDQAQAEIDHERQVIADHPDDETREDVRRLQQAGFTTTETQTMVAVLHQHPEAWLHLE